MYAFIYYEVCDGPRLRPTSHKTVSKNTLWEKTLRISFSKTSKLEKKSKCLCFQIQNLSHVVCLKNILFILQQKKRKVFNFKSKHWLNLCFMLTKKVLWIQNLGGSWFTFFVSDTENNSKIDGFEWSLSKTSYLLIRI